MKFIYLLSFFYLMVSFLLYKKNDKKLEFIDNLIYTIGLMFCYNVVIVSIYSFFKVDGSLLIISLISYLMGSILNFVSIKRKKIQKYCFSKNKLIVFLLIFVIMFFVGFIRFKGFESISYETGDPAVHYRSTIHFARELELLDANNSRDIVYGSFNNLMPFFYVNCGLVMNVFSSISTYKVFILFDIFCLILSSLLFFITIFNILKKKKMIYSFILTLLYSFAFPLNNLVFGFCYLGLGIMVINLLYLTLLNIKDYENNLVIKIIILFMINFSVFFSYYLFMPCIYLSLGIYYIYLWKSKKISFRKLLLYGIATLIIPFIIGVVHFMLPGFIDCNGGNIFSAASMEGYIYNNSSSRYFFIVISIIFLVNYISKKEKLDYFNLSYIIVVGYICLFYILYIFDLVGLYYFYKLFYLYWFLAIIFIGKLLIRKSEYLYTLFILILIGMGIVYLFPNNMFSRFLVNTNIFSWNINTFRDDKVIFNKEELKLLDESIIYNELCSINNQFLISGDSLKNVWFYAYNGNIPLFGYQFDNESPLLGEPNISFNFWSSLESYDCLVYFYEDNRINYDEERYEILYSNEEGAILKKKFN